MKTMKTMKTVTVITPTTGKETLNKLVKSLTDQIGDISIEHILLWDDTRDEMSESSSMYNSHVKNYTSYSIILPGKFVFGDASGSALRAVGMMAARGDYVTFADDDVWFEKEHLLTLLKGVEDAKSSWGYCRRMIWHDGKTIGIDEFESVGNEPCRKVPYEMVDNNSMIFVRRFATSAACLYRETTDYNDDRLMYKFLKDYAGAPAIVKNVSVHQICPDNLVEFFKIYCIKV